MQAVKVLEDESQAAGSRFWGLWKRQRRWKDETSIGASDLAVLAKTAKRRDPSGEPKTQGDWPLASGRRTDLIRFGASSTLTATITSYIAIACYHRTS